MHTEMQPLQTLHRAVEGVQQIVVNPQNQEMARVELYFAYEVWEGSWTTTRESLNQWAD